MRWGGLQGGGGSPASSSLQRAPTKSLGPAGGRAQKRPFLSGTPDSQPSGGGPTTRARRYPGGHGAARPGPSVPILDPIHVPSLQRARLCEHLPWQPRTRPRLHGQGDGGGCRAAADRRRLRASSERRPDLSGPPKGWSHNGPCSRKRPTVSPRKADRLGGRARTSADTRRRSPPGTVADTRSSRAAARGQTRRSPPARPRHPRAPGQGHVATYPASNQPRRLAPGLRGNVERGRGGSSSGDAASG